MANTGHTQTLGDVDGDGDLDLVGGDYGTSVWLNDGSGRFASTSWKRIPGAGTPGYTSSSILRDFDGDGDLDLLAASVLLTTRGTVGSRIYLNNGKGWFRDVTTQRIPASLASGYAGGVAVGDINGDGDPDIMTGGSPGLYLNDGMGSFYESEKPRLRIGDGHRSLTLADLDGDGDLDYVDGRGVHVNDGAGGAT